MRNLSPLFDQLDRRARLVRGLRYAGVVSASVAGTALLSAIVSAAIDRPIAYFALIALLSVIVLGGIGFVLGLRLPFRRSIILMRADVALGFEATLSTLNDIQGKPQMELFFKRIESRLPTESPPLRDAFPIRWREAGFLATAAIVLVAAIIVTIIPARSRQLDLRNTAAVEAAIEASESHPVIEAVSNAVAEPQPPESEAPSDASTSESTETLTLGDILTNIRSTPAAVTTANNEIDEATLRPRQTPQLSLEEVLRQIEAKLLEDESQSLSIAETDILEAYRESTQGEIAERLESILSSSPDEILDQVSQILADPELADAVKGTELPLNEQGSAQVVKVGPGVETDSPPLMLDPSADPEGQLVFVETPLPSANGDEGDYTYYLTKGVPIEPPTETTELSYQDLDLSYEQLDSIASSRSLDPDVLDTVKAYFDRIARGGS